MKFSIIIPVYNRSFYLKEALLSCFDQDFLDFDIHIVDDGSPISLESEIKEIQGQFGDYKIYYHRISNGGAAAARNHAAKVSDADYLVFLDSDDLLHPKALSFYDFIINDNSCLMLICAKRYEFSEFIPEYIFKNNYKIEDSTIIYSKNYLSKNINFRFGASNIVLPRDIFIKCGGFRIRTENTWHAEDHDLLLKVGNKIKFSFIENPYLVFYRNHCDNSINHLDKIAYGFLDIIKTDKENGYGDQILYQRKKKIIIGASLFHCIRRLFKNGYFTLIFKLVLMGNNYMLWYIINKIKKNGNRKSI
jgi:glycosyltransferase involved in cell wall biosynthesis